MRRKLRRARVLSVGFDVWTKPNDASARRVSRNMPDPSLSLAMALHTAIYFGV